MLMAVAAVCTGRAASWLQFEDVQDAEDFYSGVYGYWDYGPGTGLKIILLHV
jgi:hypothetical protein